MARALLLQFPCRHKFYPIHNIYSSPNPRYPGIPFGRAFSYIFYRRMPLQSLMRFFSCNPYPLNFAPFISYPWFLFSSLPKCFLNFCTSHGALFFVLIIFNGRIGRGNTPGNNKKACRDIYHLFTDPVIIFALNIEPYLSKAA